MAQKHQRIAFLFLSIIITFAILSSTEPTAQADGGGIIDLDTPVHADLLFGERDTWTFRGHAGQRISIAAEADRNTILNPSLTLLDPLNEPIATDEDGGIGTDAALLGVVLPQDGLYAAVVMAGAGTEGTYTLTLSENDWPETCSTPRGEAFTEDLFSDAAGEQLRYSIYLPPCHAETEKRYPYLLLMHGSDSTNMHWNNLGMDDAIAIGYALNRVPPVALLLPYGGEIANLNFFGDTYSYENVVRNEFMPTAESTFCLQRSGQGRAIGGISRGGFWAWAIGLRHRQDFVAIGGHSPVFDWQHAPNTHNPLHVISQVATADNLPRLWIDRGARDWWASSIDLMAPVLKQNSIPATVIVNAVGTHDDDYWRSQLNAYLDFYTQDWSSDWAQYPACE